MNAITCSYPRKNRIIVDRDLIHVWYCLSCGSVRQDCENDYVYSKGRWSEPGAKVMWARKGMRHD